MYVLYPREENRDKNKNRDIRIGIGAGIGERETLMLSCACLPNRFVRHTRRGLTYLEKLGGALTLL